jgi:hypothetical protein
MAYLVANPNNAALQGDPRYEAMVARVGLSRNEDCVAASLVAGEHQPNVFITLL